MAPASPGGIERRHRDIAIPIPSPRDACYSPEMRQFNECVACSCLVDARDAACPFCGASAPRSTGVPGVPWLALGFVLGLGLFDIGCVDKMGDTTNDSLSAEGVTYAGPDPYNSDPYGDTTLDPTNAEGVTYAGPDETSFPLTTSGASTTSATTTDNPTNDPSNNAEASTYAGPDESTSLDETLSTTAEPDTETGTESDTEASTEATGTTEATTGATTGGTGSTG
jgi:hypothetical protein